MGIGYHNESKGLTESFRRIGFIPLIRKIRCDMGNKDAIQRNLPRRADATLPAADWEPYLLAHSNLPGPAVTWSWPRPSRTRARRRSSAAGPASARTSRRRTRRGVSWRFAGSWGWARSWRVVRVGARSPRPACHTTTRTGRGNPAPTNVAHPRVRPALAHPRGGGDGAAALGRCGHGRPAGGDVGLGGRQPIGAARGRRGAVRAAPVEATRARRRRPAILDEITASISQLTDRRSDAFKTLRQGLGYCWSVATAALPEIGKPLMERWLDSPDPDIRWIMRENLKKNRLVRMDAEWVARWRG